jgi:hypothetical protein
MTRTTTVTNSGAFIVGLTPVAKCYSILHEREDSSILSQVQGYRYCDAPKCHNHVNVWCTLKDDNWYYTSDAVIVVLDAIPQNFCSTKCALSYLRKAL